MTVLTAIDGESIPSNPVVEGQVLAERFDEPHILLHVMPQDIFNNFRESTGSASQNAPFSSSASYGSQERMASDVVSDGDEYTVENAEQHARGVVRDVIEGTFDDPESVDGIELQGRVGEPVEEILREAERRDARYIVIGGRKRTPVGKAIFGSTTQTTLLNAEQPVLTVMSE